MSSSTSCLSFILCKRKNKRSSKSYTRPNLNISSLQGISSQKNSSTQTHISNDTGIKRERSLNHIAAAASINHKSSIAIKKEDKFFPQHQVLEKLETAESEWSMLTFKSKLSSGEASPYSLLLSKSFSNIFNSKKEEINKNCGQAKSSRILADPFVSNAMKNMPKIIAITPASCLRKRLLPVLHKNNLSKKASVVTHSQRRDEAIAEHLQQDSKLATLFFNNKEGLPIIDPILDSFEGESSNSLVNL